MLEEPWATVSKESKRQYYLRRLLRLGPAVRMTKVRMGNEEVWGTSSATIIQLAIDKAHATKLPNGKYWVESPIFIDGEGFKHYFHKEGAR